MATALEETLEQQDWLEPVDRSMQRLADVTVDLKGPVAQKVRDFLHGLWLGHPLHPALTDLPVGAWTTAALLDLTDLLTGKRRYRHAADACIGVGLLGAVPTALAGLTDWQRTSGEARRTGTLHGMLNGAGVLTYLSAWLLRRSGRRRAGQALSLLGWTGLLYSAWLGGKLVYSQRLGVDHATRDEWPDEFTAVMREEDLPQHQLHRAKVNEAAILLMRDGNEIFAIGETCAHLGGPLAEGELEGRVVTCPWHGSQYRVDTGELVSGPSVYPQPCLETRVHNGQIEVRRAGNGKRRAGSREQGAGSGE